jgi:ubiquinone/menaquinone biosynthesis C-methylase UbiE
MSTHSISTVRQFSSVSVVSEQAASEHPKHLARDPELERLREEIARLKGTRSWRITAPLRFAYERLFGLSRSGDTVSGATDASADFVSSFTKAGDRIAQQDATTSYVLNDATYWDAYVHEWETSSTNLKRLGNEWKGEEIFLDLLRSYAKPDQDALEIGCGGGRVTASAVQYVRHLNAADISTQMLRKCAESLQASNLTFHKLDGFTLNEFEPDSLDLVFSHDVFVHFSSLQVYSYLKEIARVLRPGGLGLISFYNYDVSFELFKQMSLDLQERRMFPPHMRVHFITLPMLRRMLDDLALTEVMVDMRNFLILGFERPAKP